MYMHVQLIYSSSPFFLSSLLNLPSVLSMIYQKPISKDRADLINQDAEKVIANNQLSPIICVTPMQSPLPFFLE